MTTHTFTSLAWFGVLASAGILAADDARPVIVVRISEAALNRSFDEPIGKDSTVDDIILNTRVVGTSRTVGKPRITLVENTAGATLKATFTGCTVSHAAGGYPPVVIHSRSQTDFTAAKTFAIEQPGEVRSLPTTVEARTHTSTENITTGRRLARRMILRRAWQAVEGRRAEIDATAQMNAEKRIVEAFDAAFAKRLAAVEQQMILPKLVAALLPPNSTPAYRNQTTGGYLTMAVFTQAPAEKFELALPELALAEQPMQIWLHESLVGQNFETTLAGLDAARRFLGIPIAVITSDASQRPSGPLWTKVEDWFVVQLAGAQT